MTTPAELQIWNRLGAAMSECLQTVGADAYGRVVDGVVPNAEKDADGVFTLCGALDVIDALVSATVDFKREHCPYRNGNCPNPRKPMGQGFHADCIS